MIPKSLFDWSEKAVRLLLDAGIFEAEEFDFKESLPHNKDSGGKERLRASCCAFANSIGGFLVFGVSDDRAKRADERLVGIEQGCDFPARFGSYPQLCNPSVHWEFQNPAIVLSSGRMLQVVYIPRSWKAPHATGTPEDGWRLLKRTNKGNEGMTYEEIRGSFLGFYEKRIRLQLLQTELASLQAIATEAFVADPATIETHYSLVTLNAHVIDSILADTYPLMAENPELPTVLGQLRKAVSVVNNKAQMFFSTAGLSFSNQGERNRSHNEFMKAACDRVIQLAVTAQTHVGQVLEK